LPYATFERHERDFDHRPFESPITDSREDRHVLVAEVCVRKTLNFFADTIRMRPVAFVER
jgi:hypothetical protein